MSLVKRLHEESLGWGTGPSILCAAAASEITRLRARVAELEAALEPFAFEANEWKGSPDEQEVDIYGIELGAIRRARAVLNKENEK